MNLDDIVPALNALSVGRKACSVRKIYLLRNTFEQQCEKHGIAVKRRERQTLLGKVLQK